MKYYNYLITQLISYYKIVLLFLIVGISSCQQKPELIGFDETAWKKDVKGCAGIRLKLLPVLEKEKEKLIGLRHNSIIEVLGKPEGNSLEKSGQWVYYYLVEPGLHCQDKLQIENSTKIFIQFDALDRAKYIITDK